MLNYDANHFRNKIKMLLVLELASLSALVLILVSQVCTCQSSYFSVSTFYFSIC